MLGLRERYGKRFTVQLPFQAPFVILADPADIKELFMADPEAIHPGEGARILEPLVGRKSVILLDEAEHMEQRKLMLPAFHGEKMKAMVGLMSELTDRQIATWPTGEAVGLHSRLQGLTLEIILRAVFGLEQGQRLDDLRAGLTEVLAFSENPLSLMPWAHRFGRFIPQLRRFDKVMARTNELIFEQVHERREAAHRGEELGDDVLAMLLGARHEDGSEMTDEELRDELVTALVAGHETTASQLAWAFTAIARAPHVAESLRAEVEDGTGDDYVNATVNEILRLHPVLPNAEPRLTKRPVTIGGVDYPAGVALLASAFLVHHDPEIYPEPFAFRPERFVGVTPGTYTWLPFGGGRRRCLGASFALQEMKIVLRAVVERFDLAPVGDPEKTTRRSITFSPSRGCEVRLSARIEGGDTVAPGSEPGVLTPAAA
jgi:hypothetical protein